MPPMSGAKIAWRRVMRPIEGTRLMTGGISPPRTASRGSCRRFCAARPRAASARRKPPQRRKGEAREIAGSPPRACGSRWRDDEVWSMHAWQGSLRSRVRGRAHGLGGAFVRGDHGPNSTRRWPRFEPRSAMVNRALTCLLARRGGAATRRLARFRSLFPSHPLGLAGGVAPSPEKKMQQGEVSRGETA